MMYTILYCKLEISLNNYAAGIQHRVHKDVSNTSTLKQWANINLCQVRCFDSLRMYTKMK